MFSIRGQIGKQQIYEVTWDDGQLSGDEYAIRELRRVACYYHATQTPVKVSSGPAVTRHHIRHGAVVAELLAEEVFDEIKGVVGEIPHVKLRDAVTSDYVPMASAR